MPTPCSYDFATIRIVPRVEREEFVNAGVILFCLEQKFLGAVVHLDENKVFALHPEADLAVLRKHLNSLPKICEGTADSGAIGRLSLRERFHWLVAPRSAAIQISAVHTGLSCDPNETLQQLFQRLVL